MADAAKWTPKWENSELKFFEVPKEHQTSWLEEQAQWLFSGRRWPMNPNQSMERHCRYWFPRVQKLMMQYGWSWKIEIFHLASFDLVQVTWFSMEDSAKHVSFHSRSGYYSAIIAAIICRRKARFYGLWQLTEFDPIEPF